MNEMMLRDYCLSQKSAIEDFPFGDDARVFKVMGKMFALIPVGASPARISLKCDPGWSGILRETYAAIEGAYHMNKTHWNSVICEGLKPEFIKKLIDDSYQLVFDSLTKKLKEEVLKN